MFCFFSEYKNIDAFKKVLLLNFLVSFLLISKICKEVYKIRFKDLSVLEPIIDGFIMDLGEFACK